MKHEDYASERTSTFQYMFGEIALVIVEGSYQSALKNKSKHFSAAAEGLKLE
jgi:hypothetical protein